MKIALVGQAFVNKRMYIYFRQRVYKKSTHVRVSIYTCKLSLQIVQFTIIRSSLLLKWDVFELPRRDDSNELMQYFIWTRNKTTISGILICPYSIPLSNIKRSNHRFRINLLAYKVLFKGYRFNYCKLFIFISVSI